MKKLSLVLLCLSLVNMSLIFMFSAQNGEKSSEISYNIAQKSVSESDNVKEEDIKDVEFFLRKTAHFSIFACLGFLLIGTLKTWQKIKNPKISAALSLGLCAVYAASDELHQFFVSGRDCRFTDILIDTAGSFVGICVGLFVFERIIIWYAKAVKK